MEFFELCVDMLCKIVLCCQLKNILGQTIKEVSLCGNDKSIMK